MHDERILKRFLILVLFIQAVTVNIVYLQTNDFVGIILYNLILVMISSYTRYSKIVDPNFSKRRKYHIYFEVVFCIFLGINLTYFYNSYSNNFVYLFSIFLSTTLFIANKNLLFKIKK